MYDTPIEISHSKSPAASVIWLHGLGADGNDFVPVVEVLDLPEYRFILPHAPFLNVTLNGGYEMRAWYDLYGLGASAAQDETGIRKTQGYIEGLIDKELTRGIKSNKIVLAGFSQGGAVVLHTGLRCTKKLAGVIALSTYLPLGSSLQNEKVRENQNTPIFMAHGTQDEVIKLSIAEASYQALRHEGYSVDWHEYPIGHSVSIDEIDEIRTFLLKVLA
ncbi:MAG: alpha/beta hydrolase [Methylotenera sp.]